MRAVDASDLDWTEVSGHRDGTIQFKRLLTGSEGTRENFELAVTRTLGRYYTPRHRHNYDQVRFVLSGSLNFAPTKSMSPGDVGYFPEGTFYGPQEVTGDPEFLVLQCGGASGQGFLSYDQLQEGHRELVQQGEFKNGVFRRRSGDGPETQDGYEAIWEHVQKRELTYPQARYREPIVMNPASYAWCSGGANGDERKPLGSFTERGLRVEMSRCSSGGILHVAGESAIRLGFLVSGEVRLSDGRHLRAYDALEVESGERLALEALSDPVILWMVLPKVVAS